ncbi:hypothetical protein PV679_26650, partial [Streptomyces sp. AK02-01A]|nr:hypothetical protein [Streptomyces sp. AK02-01A]
MGLINAHTEGSVMPSEMRLSWLLTGSGWADCIVADHQREAHLTVKLPLDRGHLETGIRVVPEEAVTRWQASTRSGT